MGSSSVRPARSPSIGRQERRPNGYSAPSGPRDLTSTESAIGADRSTRVRMRRSALAGCCGKPIFGVPICFAGAPRRICDVRR